MRTYKRENVKFMVTKCKVHRICKIHRKTPVPESFFKQSCRPQATLLKKEVLAQVFSYEFCEIFKNTFFIEQLRLLLFVNMLSFGLSSVTSKVSIAHFKHVFVCWERYE